eukprot:750746-Hanusia_phi.AAC.1
MWEVRRGWRHEQNLSPVELELLVLAQSVGEAVGPRKVLEELEERDAVVAALPVHLYHHLRQASLRTKRGGTGRKGEK